MNTSISRNWFVPMNIPAICVALMGFCALASVGAAPKAVPVADAWCATTAIREHRWGDALYELQNAGGVRDTAYHSLKLAIVNLNLKNYAVARQVLDEAAKRSPLLAPATRELSGDIRLLQGDLAGALTEWRAAFEKNQSEKYRSIMKDKVTALIVGQKLDVFQIGWPGAWFSIPRTVTVSRYRSAIDSLIAHDRWHEVESLTIQYLDSLGDDDLGRVLGTLFRKSPPDTARFAARTMFRIAKAAAAGLSFDFAQSWLQRIALSPDSASSLPQDEYLLLRALVAQKLAQYEEALVWASRYEKKFPPAPGEVLVRARSLRGIDKNESAGSEYERFLRLFPGDSRTFDVHWYLAWQEDDAGNTQKALKLYRTIAARFRGQPRAVEALFRVALSLYKEGHPDSAVNAWRELIRKYPDSPQNSAARYWQAKSYLASGKLDSSHSIFRSLILADPFNYYSFRAREMLAFSGDTIDSLSIDTLCDCTRGRTWLDSIGHTESIGVLPVDSLAIAAGTMLAMAGLMPQAEAFLGDNESGERSTLRFQFQLASLYRTCGVYAQSFRTARKLSLRIPAEARRKIPASVYALLYPHFYRTIIDHEAAKNNVSPDLISAVIRQESIFNAAIVSPVGAVGLMQIMPQTGRALAARLHETFAPESLYNPAVSIRLGTAYIKELIDKFDGDISLAIASYNGGPHNARIWRSLNKNDAFDVFVEDIGFAETRTYVKKVLANYWAYIHLGRNSGYVACIANNCKP